MSRALVLSLAVGLYAGTSWAQEQKPPTPPAPTQSPRPPPARTDRAELSAEDREVVENLELLESLDEAEDLELLLELSKEEE